MVARVAHAMAVESQRVVADVVEVQEYPDLARMYQVRGVPRTIINDKIQFTGAVSEDEFLKHVLAAAGEEELQDDCEAPISDQTTPIA